MDQESNDCGCTAKPARNKAHNTIVNLQYNRTEYYPDKEPAKASGGGQDDSPSAQSSRWVFNRM